MNEQKYREYQFLILEEMRRHLFSINDLKLLLRVFFKEKNRLIDKYCYFCNISLGSLSLKKYCQGRGEQRQELLFCLISVLWFFNGRCISLCSLQNKREGILERAHLLLLPCKDLFLRDFKVLTGAKFQEMAELRENNEFVKSLSHLQTFAMPRTVAYQAPPSMGFSRQEYQSGLPFPSPGDLPDPGIEPRSPALQADALPSEPHEFKLANLFPWNRKG